MHSRPAYSWVICLVLFFLIPFAPLSAQAPAAHVTLTITDPTGAVIPQADVTLSDGTHAAILGRSDEAGRCQLDDVPPGIYTVTAVAPGFAGFHQDRVTVARGRSTLIKVVLAIEMQQQQIEVSDDGSETSPEKNGGAIVMRGRDLDALSDNPSDMQQELEAIAGADPESGAQFFVDGFSGGKLPPKSSIREIRINQNPYSAEYDSFGMGRIEIFTKPGTDKLHGDIFAEGNASAFNSRNPFTLSQPPYHSYDVQGDVNGPLTKHLSYFLGGLYGASDNQSFVNAIVLGPGFQPQPFVQAVSSPQNSEGASPRFDFQWGKVQTISTRYNLDRTAQSNMLASQFSLPTQATSTHNISQTLQFSDTQAYGEKTVNESRFQYVRQRNLQTVADRTPSVAVQGAFTGGGNNAGDQRDNQDSYELQDYFSRSLGDHFLKAGVRYRATRDANRSTGGFNGQFIFPTIGSYQITQQGIANGLTPAQIRAAGGGATQFSIVTGNPNIRVLVQDIGLYLEDDWKMRPSMTLSYGMRFESQTGIHDHADAGPRLGYAWSIGQKKDKPPRAVLRAGAGLFYTRFASTNIATAERQNGITETQYVVNAPDFFPDIPSSGMLGPASSPTIYRISPLLHTPYTFTSGLSLEKTFWKHLHVSVDYVHNRGIDLLLTRNINAPLPGTYNPADPSSGIRPFGGTRNIYEYESEGASKRNRVFVHANLQTKAVSLFGFYMLGSSRANTSGASYFPSNQYNLRQDYGRASNDIRERVFLGGSLHLPYRISSGVFVIYQSSTPFNITIGQDLNGDSQFNDRPAFATDLTRASVYRTRYGNFDADPLPGQTIIPINYAHGPSYFTANMHLSRGFSFGPVIKDPEPPPAPAGKPKEPPKKKEIQHRYNLDIGVFAQNVFNYVNAAQPVGVLTSPLFGKSTALGSVFQDTVAGNRILYLNAQFHF